MNSLPYAPGSDTSRDAAETGKTNAAKWRARVAAMFAWNASDASLGHAIGYTADELAEWFNVPANTIAPRITSLKQDGEIMDSKIRRRTRSGKQAVVWVQAEPSEWRVTFYINGLCESVRLFDVNRAAAISRATCIADRTGTDTRAATKITAERV